MKRTALAVAASVMVLGLAAPAFGAGSVAIGAGSSAT